MNKVVLVKSPNGRNFKVNFSRNDEQTDFSAFKEVFYKICENDCDLNSIIKNDDHQRLSFQRFDELFQCNIELTDFEEIKNGSIIELFISTSAVLNISVESTESGNLPFNSQLPNNKTKTSFVVPVSSNMPSTSQVQNNQDDTVGKSSPSIPKKYKVPGLVYPCALPKFSAVVEQQIKNETVHQNYGRFVRECAAFLLTLTEKPSRNDYDVFCKTLTNKYTFLSLNNIPGATPYAFLKKSLSHSIRNARHYRYKKEKSSSAAQVLIDTEKVVNTTDEIQLHNEQIVKVLKKKNVDQLHLGELMKVTMHYRREIILSSNLKISELQDTFPALKLHEWILYDFSFDTSTTTEERQANFNEGIISLMKMKEETLNDDVTVLYLLKWVESKLSATKNVESCLLLLKVGDNIITTCMDLQAPHLVVYTSEGGNIAASMILAQGNVVCEISSTSVASVLDTLLGVYFTFSYEYPKAYYNFLIFLQTLLIKKTIKGQKLTSKYMKFMKEFENHQM